MLARVSSLAPALPLPGIRTGKTPPHEALRKAERHAQDNQRETKEEPDQVMDRGGLKRDYGFVELASNSSEENHRVDETDLAGAIK